MHHSTTVGPVLDENDKPVPGITFHVKGLLESNHAGELLSQDQFDALVVDDIELTRTAGGGFEYSMELVVSQQKLDAILAKKASDEAAKKAADDAANAAQQKLQTDAKAKADAEAIAAEGKRAALVEQAKQQELAKLNPPKPAAPGGAPAA